MGKNPCSGRKNAPFDKIYCQGDTHASDTTLHLLKDQEGDLPKEDSKMLFDFLAKDWANILLGKKEAKKP